MTEALRNCPFCGGRVQFRKALWPSDGNVDAIIHAEPTECGLTDFSTDTIDESVIAAWNTLRPSPDVGDAGGEVERALRLAITWFDEYAALHRAKGTSEGNDKGQRNQCRADQLRAALSHASTADVGDQAVVERLTEIKNWCEAYPATVFLEPDYEKARIALESAGMTMDGLHGSWARHLLTGIGDIARAALAAIAAKGV